VGGRAWICTGAHWYIYIYIYTPLSGMRSVPSCDGSALMYGLSYASGIWDEVVSHPVWLSYVCTFHWGILPYICAKAQAWRTGNANAAAMPSPPLSSPWAGAASIQHIGLWCIGSGPTSKTRSLSMPHFISSAGWNSLTPSGCRSSSRGLVVLEFLRCSVAIEPF
jgi:hypothetical protein